jgi:gas vesicle protein
MFAKGNSTMKFTMGLLIGGAIGGGIALLYAPSSGEELREKINTEVAADWQKARAEFEYYL